MILGCVMVTEAEMWETDPQCEHKTMVVTIAALPPPSPQ